MKNLFSADGFNFVANSDLEIIEAKHALKKGKKRTLITEQRVENRRLLQLNYRQSNAKKIKELKAKWYKYNAEAVKKKAREKYKRDCGLL